MALSTEQLLAAADSFVGRDGADYAGYAGALAVASENEIRAGWARMRGFPRTLADLLYLTAELAGADGYRQLLADTGVDPARVAADCEARLMLCRGDVATVARTIAGVFTAVHDAYVVRVGNDDVAADLAERADALATGPLLEGGFFGYGYWF